MKALGWGVKMKYYWAVEKGETADGLKSCSCL